MSERHSRPNKSLVLPSHRVPAHLARRFHQICLGVTAEILVREARQLRGTGINLPPVPKDYDVEQRGRYSAGRFKTAKRQSAHKARRKKTELPPQGIEVPPDQPQ